MDTAEKYQDVAMKALEQLAKYFDNPDSVSDRVASHATSVTSSWTRYMQQMRAKEGMVVMVAKELSENPDQFRQYLSVSLPDFPGIKKLPGKKSLP